MGLASNGIVMFWNFKSCYYWFVCSVMTSTLSFLIVLTYVFKFFSFLYSKTMLWTSAFYVDWPHINTNGIKSSVSNQWTEKSNLLFSYISLFNKSIKFVTRWCCADIFLNSDSLICCLHFFFLFPWFAVCIFL